MKTNGRPGRPRKAEQDRLVKVSLTLPRAYIQWIDRAAKLRGHGNRSFELRDIIRPAFEARHAKFAPHRDGAQSAA